MQLTRTDSGVSDVMRMRKGGGPAYFCDKMAEPDAATALRDHLQDRDVEFVEGPAENWECPICKLILFHPQLLSCCGNHLCEGCIRILQNRPCPLCNAPGFTALLDKGRQRAVLQARAYCPNKENGCQWEGELRHISAHLLGPADPRSRVTLCQYEPVLCSNDGCGKEILRANLDQHEAGECLYRKQVCEYCNNVETTYKELSEVHWAECPDFLVPCPNACGVEEMRRCDVKTHCDRECKAQMVRCPFWEVGCTIRRPRKDLPTHVKASDEHHSLLLVKKTVELQAKVVEQESIIKNLTEKLEKTNTERDEVQTRMEAQLREREEVIERLSKTNEEQAAELKKSIEDRDAALMAGFDEKLKERDKRIKALSVGLEEKLKESDATLMIGFGTKLDECDKKIVSLKDDFDKQLKDRDAKIPEVRSAMSSEMKEKLTEYGKEYQAKVTELADEVAEVVTTTANIQTLLGMETEENCLQKLEKDIATLKTTTEAECKERSDKLEKKITDESKEEREKLKEQLQALQKKWDEEKFEEKIQDVETKVDELKKDIDYVEKTITPTPPFSFTVSRFSKRREKKEPFVSEPFYTSLRGYRMVVRVDSAGTDTHVSVWCCITRGQHDDLLQWPLRADITICLVNQKDETKHFKRQISYDKQALPKHAGRVTKGDKNYLWGLREFITMKEIQNGNFLVGDALDFVVEKVEMEKAA